MNQRLNLAEVRDQLDSAISASLVGVNVRTAFERSYLTDFGKVFPAVWVCAQRLQRIDDGMGLSDQYRQAAAVDVVVRIVVQRYPDGVLDQESALNTLHDAVADALLGYTPAGADQPFTWKSSQDGALHESVITADLVFTTQITYAKELP